MILDYDYAHKVVKKNYNLYWDGWTIVSWRKDSGGMYKKNGIRIKGQWCIHERFEVRSDGKWEIPDRYVRNT
jgi:hypothetical protein